MCSEGDWKFWLQIKDTLAKNNNNNNNNNLLIRALNSITNSTKSGTKSSMGERSEEDQKKMNKDNSNTCTYLIFKTVRIYIYIYTHCKTLRMQRI
jgi:hypothetical protein